MSKKKRSTLALFAINFMILVLGVQSFVFFYVPQTQVHFPLSNRQVEGPDRGFYIQVDGSQPTCPDDLDEGVKVIFIGFNLKNSINVPIRDEKLKELETILASAAACHQSVVFRPAYDYSGDYKDPDDLATMKVHINQMAPIINAYKDHILAVQAGLFGPWGEWHNSDYIENNDQAVKNKNQVLTWWLEALDQDIVVNVRRPRFIRDALDAGLPASRLSFHNDGLLASDSDLGTYDDPNYSRAQELAWLQTNLAKGTNGGEIPMLMEGLSTGQAIEELRAMQVTYLNRFYNIDVLEAWDQVTYEGQTALDYVTNHLGYRLVVDDLTVSTAIKPKRAFNLDLTLKNLGFAPPTSQYDLYLLVKQGDKRILHRRLKKDLSQVVGDHKLEVNLSEMLDQVIDWQDLSPIDIGVYLSKRGRSGENFERTADVVDEENFEHVRLMADSQLGQVELANDNLTYIDGINWLLSFRRQDNEYLIEFK